MIGALAAGGCACGSTTHGRRGRRSTCCDGGRLAATPRLKEHAGGPQGRRSQSARRTQNKGDVNTTNIKADTGNTEKAEHSSPQRPIDKQEHEEMHTTDSDSNTQHTSNTADTGDTDKSSAQVGTNTTEGQPITEAQGRSAPSGKEGDDTATTIIQAGQEEEATEGKDDNTEATRTGSAGSEGPPSDDESGSTNSGSTKGEDTITEPEEQRQQKRPRERTRPDLPGGVRGGLHGCDDLGHREVHVRSHLWNGHGQPPQH